MISWAIHINGRRPPGWNQQRDGCWFSDFDQQEYLLPYFDVGDTQIDLYGETEFTSTDTRRLRDRLEGLRPYLEAKSEAWSITQADATASHTISLRRDELLGIIDKTLGMCEYAITKNGGLVFGGD